ncbi:DUF4097 family beta strand repeat-containing protein [Dactylosporangium matsuzakiense]|uniref:DUF4097 domain-containing protein n=1 Tax=Dactylosporangium matsuzakiense TaxID=53360 RepID=A0A9W6KG87_9ACTN|nr:DUF4097 domain-containing protein [Dactylosporangium matsuzakiense]UWZ46027.1 DUF4097 family beta strand repeat protein [Dactylosporangium matsuzakiense]GLL00150.1 hypothetical protein GCM10017581_018900 [Dactylosporangium matsuzakiense]
MTAWKIGEPERLAFDEEVVDLNVSLVAGRLNVVGSDDGPARVEVAEIGDRAVSVELGNGRLDVSQDFPRGWPGFLWWLFSARFKVDVSVVVPTGTTVRLHVASGTIIASSLRNGASVNVTSGRITLLGLDGRVTGRIVSGSIEGLTLGGEVELETVSGEIVVADSTAAKVTARTISGSVTCDLDNPPAGTAVHLDTVSGEITARVREDSDLRVSLHAVSGHVISAFSELDQHSRNSVTGRIGTGAGGQLAASATSGSISLLRRPVDDEEDVSR